MNVKKFIAGVLACCVMGGVVPTVESVTNTTVMTANAVDYDDDTEEIYELLTYKNYGDHIEITGRKGSETEIVIPSEIDGLPVTSIASSAFWTCRIESIVIPDSVTTIGASAFSECTILSSIEIPDSVINIGENAFENTPWLETKREENPLVTVNGILIDGQSCSGDVVIPDGITSIGNYAFDK
ncbi:MAG: leucine-rich repeat domain-containing protein, partial [Oscillospiraceae bacterium]|nr:leucine-rich repeat domain-containing protein [Oscillospiraceae bacterium]